MVEFFLDSLLSTKIIPRSFFNSLENIKPINLLLKVSQYFTVTTGVDDDDFKIAPGLLAQGIEAVVEVVTAV